MLSPLLFLVSYKYFWLSRCSHFSFIRLIFFPSIAFSSSFRHISFFTSSYFLLFYLLQYFSSHFCILFFLALPPRLLFLAYSWSPFFTVFIIFLPLFILPYTFPYLPFFLSFILSFYLSRHQFLIFFITQPLCIGTLQQFNVAILFLRTRVSSFIKILLLRRIHVRARALRVVKYNYETTLLKKNRSFCRIYLKKRKLIRDFKIKRTTQEPNRLNKHFILD